MLQFLAVLIQAMEMSGLEIAVFFNGCFEPLRRADWVQHQLQMRAKVNNVSLVQLHHWIKWRKIEIYETIVLNYQGPETHNNERYTAAENLVDFPSMFKDKLTHGS